MASIDRAMAELALFEAQASTAHANYDEALAVLESVSTHHLPQNLVAQFTLSRAKIALRKNDFEQLFSLMKEFSEYDRNPAELAIEMLRIVNTAARDLFDISAIADSSQRLIELVESNRFSNTVVCKAYRSISRSFAKLEKLDDAIRYAREALDLAMKIDSVRDIGNANLALAEANRYAGNFNDAVSSYYLASDIAQDIGNKDSLNWARLGLADAFRLQNKNSSAAEVLTQFDRDFDQSEYSLRLEPLHAAALRKLNGGDKNIANWAKLLSCYEALQIKWPRSWLEHKSYGVYPM